jgi:hypothetical protein
MNPVQMKPLAYYSFIVVRFASITESNAQLPIKRGPCERYSNTETKTSLAQLIAMSGNDFK